jgi:DNA-3-methyladenine glycosylase
LIHGLNFPGKRGIDLPREDAQKVMHLILDQQFFSRDVLEVAPQLPGKKIIRIINGERKEWIITEVEAYRGTEDLACHASKGRTKRTEIMYHEGGHIYMYLIYGMYWMLNIVTGKKDIPQAVLIRSLKGVQGPGRVSRELELDGGFYGEKIYDSGRIWIEEGIKSPEIQTSARKGVEYAGEYWSSQPWRFFILYH